MKPKVYRPKFLIDGKQIDMPGSDWIAVPDKFAGKKFQVIYKGITMTVKDWKAEAKMFKRFRDKFWKEGSNRPQHYTLGYFRFRPDDNMPKTIRAPEGFGDNGNYQYN